MPSNTLNNILLFNHSNLSIGEHTLVVTSNGSNTGTPLDINYFLAQSLTTEEQASLSSHPFTNSTATPNAPTGSSISHSGNANTKVIVGAALGAVSSVLLVTTATFLWFRIKSRKKKELLAVKYIPFWGYNPVNSNCSVSFFAHIIEILSDATPSHPHGEKVQSGSIPSTKFVQNYGLMQAQRRERPQLEESLPPIIHTDSGLRVAVEERKIDSELNEVRTEMPPDYTEE